MFEPQPVVLALSGHESEIIELAMTYGFKGLDLNFEDFRDRAKAKGIDYARRLIVSATSTGRLRMGTFDLPIQWDVSDEAFAKELAALPELAKMAADLGCKRCLALIPPAGDRRPYHENLITNSASEIFAGPCCRWESVSAGIPRRRESAKVRLSSSSTTWRDPPDPLIDARTSACCWMRGISAAGDARRT